MNDSQQEQNPIEESNLESSPEADLALIRKMMSQAQSSAVIDGRYLILWGCVLGLTQGLVIFTTRFMGNTENQWTIFIWSVMLGIGIVLTIFLVYLHSRSVVNSGVRTYASVWIGFGLTMCLLFILAATGQQAVLFSLAIVAPAMTGLAFFATAAIIGLGWMRWVAICWWITAILVALFDETLFIEILFMLAYLILMAGPGLAIAKSGQRA